MLDSTDATLIEDTLRGEEAAFAELVRRYQGAVWSAVHRTLGSTSEGEDAVQEIFLRAFTSLHKFDRRYPFGPWIQRIATNFCIDQLRRKRARKYQLWSELREEDQERLLRDFSRNGDFDAVMNESPEAYEKVAQALLAQLKPKYRTAFVLREMEGREYIEVAKALGTSELAARVRVSRARTEIQKLFHKYLSGEQKGMRK